ncbi:MAG TPA: hypothetical protein VK527_11580 [Candidatus Limnocylindrales bacterium]|nr:hypothetical protein [Candidatus Limnocylindrales bacterium]
MNRPVDLPTPIAIYIAAENRGDTEALAQCFAERHTVEPLASAQKDGKTIVTTRLTGNFPGSPIEVQFIFALEGDKIGSLEIL